MSCRSPVPVLLAGLVLAPVAACGPGDDPAPARASAEAPARPAADVPGSPADRTVDEIPVTSAAPDAVTAFVEGRRLADVGRLVQAAERFRAATAVDPDFTYAWLGLAGAAQSAEEFKTALDRAAATAEDKSDGERLLVRIHQTFLADDAERRLDLARELVGAHPRSVRARLELASAHAAMDRHGEARHVLEEAMEMAPEMYVTHVNLGFSYLFDEPRDPARAARYMKYCVLLDPEEAKAHEALGDARRATGDLEGARAAYGVALEKDPGLGVAALKKGHINSFLDRFDEALADYDAGVRDAKEGERVGYLNFRAFVHVHAGEPEKAIRELERVAASADEDDVPVRQRAGAKIFTLTNAATVAVHAGLADEAERILGERARVMMEEADRIGDDRFRVSQEADVRLWEARLALARGDLEGARAKLEEHRALQVEERNPTRLQGYHTHLGIVELHDENPAGAVRHLRQGDPEDIWARYHLGLALEASGDPDGARAHFAAVADYNFNSVEFALLRRDALRRKG